jgi:ribosomal protein L40E
MTLLEFRENAPEATGYREQLLELRKSLDCVLDKWDYNAYVGILLGVSGPKHGDPACSNYAIGQGDNGNNTKLTLERRGLMPLFQKYKGKQVSPSVTLSEVEDEIVAAVPEYQSIREQFHVITGEEEDDFNDFFEKMFGFGTSEPEPETETCEQSKAEQETQICGKCGAKLPEGSNFCLKCGAKVGAVAAECDVDEEYDTYWCRGAHSEAGGYNFDGFHIYKGDVYFVAFKGFITGKEKNPDIIGSQIPKDDSMLVIWSREEKCFKVLIEKFDKEFTIFNDKIYYFDTECILDATYRYIVVCGLKDGKELERISITDRLERHSSPLGPIMINRSGEFIFGNGKSIVSQSGKEIPGHVYYFCVAYNDRYMYIQKERNDGTHRNILECIDIERMEVVAEWEDADYCWAELWVDARTNVVYTKMGREENQRIIGTNLKGAVVVDEIVYQDILFNGKHLWEINGDSKFGVATKFAGYGMGVKSIGYNGDVRYIVIDSYCVKVGEEYGVIFFDMQGNEIKRVTEVKKREMRSMELLFNFPGIISFSWDETGKLNDSDENNGDEGKNVRWKYRVFYTTKNSVEEGTPIWGGIRRY